jgi:hypothetical protein
LPDSLDNQGLDQGLEALDLRRARAVTVQLDPILRPTRGLENQSVP